MYNINETIDSHSYYLDMYFGSIIHFFLWIQSVSYFDQYHKTSIHMYQYNQYNQNTQGFSHRRYIPPILCAYVITFGLLCYGFLCIYVT